MAINPNSNKKSADAIDSQVALPYRASGPVRYESLGIKRRESGGLAWTEEVTSPGASSWPCPKVFVEVYREPYRKLNQSVCIQHIYRFVLGVVHTISGEKRSKFDAST
jgi:hypothetical protein